MVPAATLLEVFTGFAFEDDAAATWLDFLTAVAGVFGATDGFGALEDLAAGLLTILVAAVAGFLPALALDLEVGTGSLGSSSSTIGSSSSSGGGSTSGAFFFAAAAFLLAALAAFLSSG